MSKHHWSLQLLKLAVMPNKHQRNNYCMACRAETTWQKSWIIYAMFLFQIVSMKDYYHPIVFACDYIMLTFHKLHQRKNGVLSAYLLKAEQLQRKYSSISMEVTLLDAQLISLQLRMGAVPIISRCALFIAQQSFSWLLCERRTAWVAVTGPASGGPSAKVWWMLLSASQNRSCSNLPLRIRDLHQIKNLFPNKVCREQYSHRQRNKSWQQLRNFSTYRLLFWKFSLICRIISKLCHTTEICAKRR